MTDFAIVEAPSVLGLFPRGVEGMAGALLEAGLAERLGARRAGLVEPPAYDGRRDPESGLLNPESLRDYSIALADAVEPLLASGAFPVVLGGDCSILLGCTLATRRRGRAGLLFVDGHADFYQPEAEPAGEAASMDLALVTGRGPLIVTDLEGRRPLVRDADVVALARRDAEETEAHGSQRIEDTGIDVIDLGALRAAGVEAAMRRRWNVSLRPFSTGSGSISTQTRSTMRSCRRWTTAFLMGSAGTSWLRSCERRCTRGEPSASTSPSSIRSSIRTAALRSASSERSAMD